MKHTAELIPTWDENVKMVLYHDELTDRMKKQLINLATNYYTTSFKQTLDSKLKWVRFIGGKENYELRRELEGKCLKIYNLLTTDFDSSSRTIYAIRAEIEQILGVENISGYNFGEIIYSVLSNDDLIHLIDTYSKKLNADRKYRYNSYCKEELWKKNILREEVGDINELI